MKFTMKITPPLPEWVERWLNISFYEEKCSKHPKKYNTIYCGTCNHDPVCVICWESFSAQHHHDHHQVLLVRIASGRAAIDETEISEFIDVSKIQIYSINGKKIVFLNPHEQGASSPDFKPNCRTCGRKLIKDDERFRYEFCSIACMIRRKEVGDMEIEEKRYDGETSAINTNLMIKRKLMMINDECCSPSASLRKRSRKGISCRGPFM